MNDEYIEVAVTMKGEKIMNDFFVYSLSFFHYLRYVFIMFLVLCNCCFVGVERVCNSGEKVKKDDDDDEKIC